MEPDCDLAISSADIQIGPENPVPGTDALITATVHNNGDEAEYSAVWTVPESIEPHEIFVVVDPYQVQEDRDRTNNSASVVVLAADLTITEIAVQAAGPRRITTIRVENIGSLEVPAVDVVLRRDAVDGEVLTTFSITDSVVAGAYRDVFWIWEDAAPFPGGSVQLYAIVDEDDLIGEFDETNNVRVAVRSNELPENPGDWDEVIARVTEALKEKVKTTNG